MLELWSIQILTGLKAVGQIYFRKVAFLYVSVCVLDTIHGGREKDKIIEYRPAAAAVVAAATNLTSSAHTKRINSESKRTE